MSSTSFSTTSSMSTNSESFQTISSDESAEDDVIYCENNLCIYCWTSSAEGAGHFVARGRPTTYVSCCSSAS